MYRYYKLVLFHFMTKKKKYKNIKYTETQDQTQEYLQEGSALINTMKRGCHNQLIKSVHYSRPFMK